MGNDEVAAYELLRKNRKIQRPIIEKYNGEWLKEIGDGVLASFSSASEAVYCAIEIQELCLKEPDLKLRIGIHLGEVMIEDGDVFGDGVNIASRLEPLAPVGGIYVSESVFRNIQNKKGIATRFVKEKGLKNIKHSIKIYEIKVAKEIESDPSRKIIKNWDKIPYFIGIGLFTVIIVVFLIWKNILIPTSIYEEHELEKSIAVLPFENMSVDEEYSHIGDAFTDEIILELQKVKEFDRILSRTSTIQYKDNKPTIPEIAEKLGVNYLIEGSIQRHKKDVSIRVQVIRAKNEDHVWGDEFDGKWEDIFSIQDQIAIQVANELKAVLSPAEKEQIDKQPTYNIEAYDLYLKGRYFLSKRTEKDLFEAIEYFDKTIKIDTNFALAYTGLADCYNLIADFMYFSSENGLRNNYQKGREAAIRALEIDNTSAEAHTSLAFIKLYYDWDWFGAKEEFKRAIQLNPNYGTAHQWYANCNTVFRKHDEAIAEAKMARELDPLSLIINRNVGYRFYFARRFDNAIEESLKALQIEPDFYPTLWTLSLSYLQKGMFTEAILEMQKAAKYSGENRLIQAFMGYVYGISGNQTKAQLILNDFIEISKEEYVPAIFFATIYIGIGKNDNALNWLEKAYEEHASHLIYLNTNPIYDPLRTEPRFIDLMRKMDYPTD
jgi:TolB-like protein/Flp pilus assembly protein TadD